MRITYINCSFLYLLSALVNKGNCLFANGEYEKAREYYQEAYNVEASCTEALFNLGVSWMIHSFGKLMSQLVNQLSRQVVTQLIC